MYDDDDDHNDAFSAQRQVQLAFTPHKGDLSEVGSTAFLIEISNEQFS